jgi:transposase
MGKPKSRSQLSLVAAGMVDDWGGIPADHWSYQFYEHVLLAFDDASFAELYAPGGRQPVSPRLLCGVMVLQYMYRVSDRVAVDNTIMRRDWRIALGLEPGYQGFHPTVLCYFRRRLLEHGRERVVFDTVWQRVRELGLVRQHSKVRVDATQLIADVAVLNRGDMLREALRVVVCDLGAARPKLWRRREFLALHQRYGVESWLGGSPAAGAALCDLARDGQLLLQLCGPYEIKGRATLAQMLAENFVFDGEGPRARPLAELPPDHLATPHEPDVEVGKEGDQLWLGDKVHVVETTAGGEPGFLSDLVVTGPRVPDNRLLPELAQRVVFNTPALDTLLADSGYAAAGNSA